MPLQVEILGGACGQVIPVGIRGSVRGPPRSSCRSGGSLLFPGRRPSIPLTQASGAPERQGFAQPPGTQGQQRHRLQCRPPGRALPERKKGRSEGWHGAGRGEGGDGGSLSRCHRCFFGRDCVSRCCGLHMTFRWQDHDSLLAWSADGARGVRPLRSLRLCSAPARLPASAQVCARPCSFVLLLCSAPMERPLPLVHHVAHRR